MAIQRMMPMQNHSDEWLSGYSGSKVNLMVSNKVIIFFEKL